MSSELDDMDYETLGIEDDGEISFDDAPPQVKPTVAAKPAPAHKAAPKPKVRKTTVAKTAATPAKAKSKHRVETIDNNKLAAYLDKIVNDEGYQLISVTGSSSMMGMFIVVSVKVG
jgi:hypothetical protein